MSQFIHRRQLIREAFFGITKEAVERIKGKDSKPQIQNFSKNRFRPYWEGECYPAMSVYTIEENSTLGDEAPRTYKRELTLAIEIVVKEKEDADDFLDACAKVIEDALFIEDTLCNTVSDCRLISTSLIEKPEGDSLMGSLIMEWQATYYDYAPGEQNLPIFKGVDFEMKLGADGTPIFQGKADVPV